MCYIFIFLIIATHLSVRYFLSEIHVIPEGNYPREILENGDVVICHKQRQLQEKSDLDNVIPGKRISFTFNRPI